MRAFADEARIRMLIQRLGERCRTPARVWLTGGATAVLLGWRPSTVDVDLSFDPDTADIYAALPDIKEALDLNIELAAPDHFIPPLPGWKDRSLFVAAAGPIQVFHYDLYSQALSKIERGHTQDLSDVREMARRGLIGGEGLRRWFEVIRADLVRYPAIEPERFAEKVERMAKELDNG